ncbi:pentapeptide repeat-containing protein [Microcoleus sp. T2B6]|uniref:pentapeptide repeat-containing protein n=1 Tax=Microcoleus sp. T2B6 TaxID=3055424 RepID=UPI002FD6748C
MPGLFWREMSASELLDRYAAGDRNFAGIRVSAFIYLEGAILSNANFCGAFLEGSMIGTDFTRSYLIGAELAEVSLEDAILQHTRLDGATLAQSILSGADLTHARLVRAELDETLVEKTNLYRCNLFGASGVDIEYWLEQECIFCHTIMPDGSERNDGCQRLGICVS